MSTIKELREEAKAMRLHDYSALNKAELIHLIEKVKKKRAKGKKRAVKRKPRQPPPLYTEEVLPSYEDAVSDSPPDFHEDIAKLRTVIIDSFPNEYMNNSEQFYKDWDKIIAKQKKSGTMTKIEKAVISSIERDILSREWKRTRSTMFGYVYLGPIYQRLNVKMKLPMVSSATQHLFNDLFNGIRPRSKYELANDLSLFNDLDAADKKEFWKQFGHTVLRLLPIYKKIFGIDIVPQSTRLEMPEILQNNAVKNAKDEVVIKKV